MVGTVHAGDFDHADACLRDYERRVYGQLLYEIFVRVLLRLLDRVAYRVRHQKDARRRKNWLRGWLDEERADERLLEFPEIAIDRWRESVFSWDSRIVEPYCERL